MKLNVYATQDLTALRLFDFYYAYKQAQNRNSGYQTNINITITDNPAPAPGAVNIAMVYMPEEPIDSIVDAFDLVLLDNQHHPLEICTEVIFQSIQRYKNCYFVNGARLTDNYPFSEKFIYLDLDASLEYFGQAQYPQYYELAEYSDKQRKPMAYINGQNRTNRQYFMEMVEHLVPCRNTWPRMSPMFESFFEDTQDQQYRTDMNARYQWKPDASEWSQNHYYADSVQLGSQGKYGTLPPGYFLLDDYFDYQCIIYSDTCWLNNQMFLSEKLGKCAVAQTIPWPVGGANINQLYNDAGYLTAWNLLPDMLQLYDANLNHFERMQQTARAVEWAKQHPEIWISNQAQHIRAHNIANFYKKKTNVAGVKKLDEILKEYERRH